MCLESCIGFTGPFADPEIRPYCGEDRYTQPGGSIPRKQFHIIPIGPQLQTLWRSIEGAELMRYRLDCTEKIPAELRVNEGVKVSPYRDFFDGSNYLQAGLDRRMCAGDMVPILSIDGAQLCRMTVSDCWIYIWIDLDIAPESQYKKNRPKYLNSFMFPGLLHLSVIRRDGLRVWGAKDDRVFESDPFMALRKRERFTILLK
ncbi:hypothetical protein IW262DRAFT_1450588 [Armillaria fumosa]|nr:hypothetical protein IW262DRAFT_1450588 [Armillaria fumosa]